MTKERLQTVLNNLVEWATDHDSDFLECFIEAADLTSEEKKELELEDEDCE